MKFLNGKWLHRDGITPSHAVELCETQIRGNDLRIITSTLSAIPGEHRRRIGGVGLTIDVTAPAKNVIGIRLSHFKGKQSKGPEYTINKEDVQAQIDENDELVTYTSGELSVSFNKVNGPMNWRAEFAANGKLLTASEDRSMTYFEDSKSGKKYISQQLTIDVGECLYGLGERFGPFVKNGQTVDMWMGDGGTSSDLAYKNVPFYFSNRGYGVFVNSATDVSFEMGTENVERVGFSVEDETIEYFVIYGKTPREIMERYTFLTGRPALPPAWSFGLWLSTSFMTDYNEETATSFIDGMAERNIPLHVFHFDCFWMKGNHWTDFEWDAKMFPDPKGMLARYKEKGLHICVWINPYIAQASSVFDECVEKGYFIKKTNGDVWQTDLWQPGMGVIDFTNPEAYAWYQQKLDELMDMGVDCFKTDFGERIPVRDIAYYDGSDPVKMHNYYTYLYNKCVFDVTEKRKGKGNAVLFARSGTAGSQQFPVHWGGDNYGTFVSMAETLRAGLSLAMCGYGFWSHDIGGFETKAAADLYKRWCAFGALSSHTRLHGSTSYRVPWNYDEESSGVLEHFIKLKCGLMPYIYMQAINSNAYGTPVLRPLVFDFMEDEVAAYVDRQFMLGDNLLVAPVFREDGVVSFYVPEGKWTDIQTGKVYDGGRYHKETCDYLSMPILARPNSIIAVGGDNTRPDYDYTQNLTLRVFEIEENAEILVSVPKTDGSIAAEIKVSMKNGKLSANSDKSLDGLKLEYKGEIFAADAL